ncbi:putative homoserine kinase [Helianthus annuus]|nr:putative homoserine kinase [Helianthus annuus]
MAISIVFSHTLFSGNHTLFSGKQKLFSGTLTQHNLFASRRPLRFKIQMSSSSVDPLFGMVKAYAPATIAHFGSDFEMLGCALRGMGNTVTLKIDSDLPAGELILPNLPVGLNRLNIPGIASSLGVSVFIQPGVPPGRGLGCTAATIAAVAKAIKEMFGEVWPVEDVITAAQDLGVYRSNIVPALYGDFIGYELKEGDPYPWGLRPLHFPSNKSIWFVLAIPNIENPKRKVVLDLHWEKVESSESIKWYHNMHAKMMAAVRLGNLEELGFGMSSSMKTEAILQRFVPAFYSVKAAAKEAGALGCCIAGAGPAVVALTDDEVKGQCIGELMVQAFEEDGGVSAVAVVQTLDRLGARLISRQLLSLMIYIETVDLKWVTSK